MRSLIPPVGLALVVGGCFDEPATVGNGTDSQSMTSAMTDMATSDDPGSSSGDAEADDSSSSSSGIWGSTSSTTSDTFETFETNETADTLPTTTGTAGDTAMSGADEGSSTAVGEVGTG